MGKKLTETGTHESDDLDSRVSVKQMGKKTRLAAIARVLTRAARDGVVVVLHEFMLASCAVLPYTSLSDRISLSTAGTRVFGYFSEENGHSRTTNTHMAARTGENLPSVDSLGELVAFQGPPKLTALDISPLHIPLDHFHQHRLSDVTRGTLRGMEKSRHRIEYLFSRQGLARGKNSSSLSRARLLSVSFVVIRLWTDSRSHDGLPSS